MAERSDWDKTYDAWDSVPKASTFSNGERIVSIKMYNEDEKCKTTRLLAVSALADVMAGIKDGTAARDLNIDFAEIAEAKELFEQEGKGTELIKNVNNWKQGLFAFNTPYENDYGNTIDRYRPAFVLPTISPLLPDLGDHAAMVGGWDDGSSGFDSGFDSDVIDVSGEEEESFFMPLFSI